MTGETLTDQEKYAYILGYCMHIFHEKQVQKEFQDMDNVKNICASMVNKIGRRLGLTHRDEGFAVALADLNVQELADKAMDEMMR